MLKKSWTMVFRQIYIYKGLYKHSSEVAKDFKTKILKLVGKSSKYGTMLYEKLHSIFLNEDLELRCETLTQSSIVFFLFNDA